MKFSGLGLVFLVAGLLLIGGASATAGDPVSLPVSEDLKEYIDTSGSGYWFYSGGTTDQKYSVSTIHIADITKCSVLSYVCIDIPEISSRYVLLSDGTYDASYTLGGQTHPCSIQVESSYPNPLNQNVKHVRFTIFFPDWDIGTLIGPQNIGLSMALVTSYSMYQGSRNCEGDSSFSLVGEDKYPYTISHASAIDWVNHITIEEAYDNSYHVKLDRNINGKYYASTVNCTKLGVPYYTSKKSEDENLYFIKSVVDTITVESPQKKYIFVLSATNQDDFSLSLSSKAVPIYGPVQATLSVSADAPAYDCVYWNWDSYDLHDERQYRKIGGTWHETRYNGTTQTYENTPTTDNPLVQSISFPDEGVNHRISVRVYNLANSEKLADLTEYVTVSGQSSTYWPLYVGVYDGVTGKALLNVICEIKNLNTGETTTKTIQRNYFGENLQLNAADAYKISISKNGYESRTWDRLTSRTTKITAYLPKLADPEHPDQIKIYLTVAEPGGQPIPGATVQVSGLPVAVTNAQGQVQITATANTSYQYTVSKTGYIGASDTLTTLSTSFWQVIHLTPEGAVPTTDPAPGTTPDYRTVDQKATSALDILFDNVELIATLAGLILVCNMLTWILPGGKR